MNDKSVELRLSCPKYSKKVVYVSMELFGDSYFDVAKIRRDLLSERIARSTNTHFTPEKSK